MVVERRIRGATPHGGVEAVIVYMDDERSVVDEEVATQAAIRELDKNGNLVFETWGRIDHD
jgi:hypothetical protein